MIFGGKFSKLQNDSNSTMDEKIEIINNMSTGELLDVVRNFEEKPEIYEPDVISLVIGRLSSKNIFCVW